jgi:glycosyltransferase involved in cell wall biosynthesis
MGDQKPTTLEESPFFKTAEIEHPSDVKDPSPISLHLLVKNGAGVVGRLLDNVGPYVHEIVAVLNDCEDETEGIIAAYCRDKGIEFKPVRVTRSTYPELYILDTRKTYQIGRSLNGEDFGGPFTEEPILADWSAARNIGWSACTKKWRLFLDSDDVVSDPECIPGLCKLLEAQGVELCISPYHYHVDAQERPRGRSMRERLAVNKPNIRWVNPIHETLVGTTRVAHLQTNLVVRDMRDNAGKAVRIPGRNFKILYQRARARDWDVSPRLLADLIMEVRHMAGTPGMMEFADALLAKYMEDASWPEERGWVLALVGEMHEGLEELDKAIEHYRESLEIHPGSKTAFRLCRALFKKACELKEGLEVSWESAKKAPGEFVIPTPEQHHQLTAAWRAVVEAYELGVANKVVHQVLDDGPLHEEMEKIHVAGAMMELGDVAGAKKFVDEAVLAFPENSSLKQMQKQVEQTIKPLAAEDPAPEQCMDCGEVIVGAHGHCPAGDVPVED